MPKKAPTNSRLPPRRSEAQTEVEESAGSGRTPGRQPPWERGAEAETGSFGTWLRRQRELREISLRDVAERTKISLRYLEAMEDDRFDLLPAPVFAKGFLREYARYIGLSPDEVVNHYLSAHGLDGSGAAAEEPVVDHAPARRRGRLLIVLLAVLLGLALAAAVYFYLQQRGDEAVPGPAAPGAAETGSLALASPPVLPAAMPVGSDGGPSPEGPKSPIEVTLDFTRDCWVEATVDGKPTIAEQRVAGEALQISAQQEVILKLGNAAGVEAQVNGQLLPLPAVTEGQVLSDLKIDLETVRSLRAKKEAG